MALKNNRTFRTSVNVFGAFMVSMACFKVGAWLIMKDPITALAWSLVLFTLILLAWMWVYLWSLPSNPANAQQKETGRQVTYVALALAAFCAGLLMFQGRPSQGELILGYVLITVSLAPLWPLGDWMLKKETPKAYE